MVASSQDDCPEALSCCFARPRGEAESYSYLERLPRRAVDQDEEMIGFRVTDPLLGVHGVDQSQETTSTSHTLAQPNCPRRSPSLPMSRKLQEKKTTSSSKFLDRCALQRPEALLDTFIGDDDFLPSGTSVGSTREGYESPLATLLLSPCSRTPSHALKSPPRKSLAAASPPVSHGKHEVGHSVRTPPTGSTVATTTAYYTLRTPLHMGTVEAPMSSSAGAARRRASPLRLEAERTEADMEVPEFEMMTPVSVRTESCITAEIDLTDKFCDLSDDEVGSFRLDITGRALDQDLFQCRSPAKNSAWHPGEGL